MPQDERLHGLLMDLHRGASERVSRLSGSLEGLTSARRGEPDDDEHDPEGVTLSSEWSRLSGVLDNARLELREVEAALARWDAGTYGVCVDCGRPIPPARLEVRPFADRCVPCAEAAGG